MTNKVVLYHNDADGFASAVVAKKVLAGPVEFYPVQYGEDLPGDLENKEIYILDFSYPRDVLLKMKEGVNKIVVLDHHKTAQKELEGLDFCHFDMSKSGAVLTWEYFYKDKIVPEVLLYVQDRDLWEWKLPNSREINAAIRSYSFDFGMWQQWMELDSLVFLLTEGAAVIRDQNRYIESKIKHEPEWITIDGFRVPALNNTYLVSEVTQALYEHHKTSFAASYFDMPGKRVFSLRSRSSGIDVGEVAKHYGGGGHAGAAGFTIPLPKTTAIMPEAKFNERYRVSPKGIIFDTKTDLEWFMGPDKDINHYGVKTWVKSLTVGGGNWRMPTMEELKGICEKNKVTEKSKDGYGIHLDLVFKNFGECRVWTGKLTDNSSSTYPFEYYFDFYRDCEDWLFRNFSSLFRAFAVRSVK